MPGHYGNGNGNGMRTMSGTSATPRRGRAATPRRGRMMNGNGRMMNGTGARGVRRMTGPMGRGGVRRARTQRPAPVMRRGITQPMMRNQTPARGIMTAGTGAQGFRGVDQFGRNH